MMELDVIAVNDAQTSERLAPGHEWAQHVLVTMQQSSCDEIRIEVICIPCNVIHARELGVEEPRRDHISQVFHRPQRAVEVKRWVLAVGRQIKRPGRPDADPGCLEVVRDHSHGRRGLLSSLAG